MNWKEIYLFTKQNINKMMKKKIIIKNQNEKINHPNIKKCKTIILFYFKLWILPKINNNLIKLSNEIKIIFIFNNKI